MWSRDVPNVNDYVINKSGYLLTKMSLDLFNIFFLQLVFNFACARGARLTELLVPVLADPRDELTLDCRFDMESDELYSVKWYKDDQEFFRYTPRQQPHFMAFPVAGVHLVPPTLADSASSSSASPCNTHQCTVQLTQLSTAHSSGSYKCEVSTEAPSFSVAFDAANVTVAAVGRADPQVDGIRPVYTLGDLVFANCTSAPADPAPLVSWLLNGKPAPSIALGQPRTSRPDIHGLVTRSLMLRFHVERRHLVEPAGSLELRCVASMPGLLPAPVPKVTVVTVAIRDPSRNALSNQKLKWLNHNAVTKPVPVQWIGHIAILTVLIVCR